MVAAVDWDDNMTVVELLDDTLRWRHAQGLPPLTVDIEISSYSNSADDEFWDEVDAARDQRVKEINAAERDIVRIYSRSEPLNASYPASHRFCF
jgi:hypothetical protein